MEIEFKWKLEIDGIQRLITESPSISSCINAQNRIRMKSVYFDTPDEQLKNRSIALRMRKENEKEFCYLKTRIKDESNLFIRNEYVYETNNIKHGIEHFIEMPEIKNLFLGIELYNIREMCIIEFERIVFEIDYSQSDKIFNAELCFDRGYGRKYSITAPISEIELEFVAGDQELFLDFATQFEKMFSLRREYKSKIAQIK